MAVIAVTKERRAGETRVAAVPETVKKLIGAGFSVIVESGAGLQRVITEADVEQARTLRRDDLPGKPLAWQVALRELVAGLTGRVEIARR